MLVEDRWEVDLWSGTVTERDPDTAEAVPAPDSVQRESCTFAGQDAILETTKKSTRLISDPEGYLLLDAGEQNLVVSPAGDNMILYSRSFTPLLIRAADLRTLILTAKERLASVP